MSEKFLKSQQPGGPHHFLAQLEGRWHGWSKLWFEADQTAAESPVEGTFRPILEGRFMLHEYQNYIEPNQIYGVAIHGYDLSQHRFVTAWVDSFHNGSTIMLSKGGPGAWPSACSVLGSYGDPDGGPPWGWRTTLEQPDPEHLLVRHYNIDPAGNELIAVEFDYRRAA